MTDLAAHANVVPFRPRVTLGLLVYPSGLLTCAACHAEQPAAVVSLHAPVLECYACHRLAVNSPRWDP